MAMTKKEKEALVRIIAEKLQKIDKAIQNAVELKNQNNSGETNVN